MNPEVVKDELIKAHKSHPRHASGEQQQFTVVFSPATKLTCSIISARNQSYPVIFGRCDSRGTLDSMRIIATPEGNPSALALYGSPTDADAQIAADFYMSEVSDGDTLELQKLEGKKPCHVILFLWIDGTPTEVHRVVLADNIEHSFKIRLPKA